MDANLVLLYDIYGKLLTDKQRSYFEDYHFNNLSLSEISDKNKVSRNAIHKQLKVVKNKLNEYESNLKINKKSIMIKEIIDNIDDESIKNKLNKINDRM